MASGEWYDWNAAILSAWGSVVSTAYRPAIHPPIRHSHLPHALPRIHVIIRQPVRKFSQRAETLMLYSTTASTPVIQAQSGVIAMFHYEKNQEDKK